MRLTLMAASLGLTACTQSVLVQPTRGENHTPPQHLQSDASAPTYSVQAGDTLYKISVQYGVDYRDLAEWNNISAPYTIYPRQTLRVGPRGMAASPQMDRQTAAVSVPAPAPTAGSNATASVATPVRPNVSTTSSSSPPHAPGYDANLGVTLPAGAQAIGSAPAANSATFETVERLPTVAAGAAAGTTPTAAPGTVAALPTAPPPTPATVAPVRPGATATPVPSTASVDTAARPSAAGWIWPTPGKVVVSYASGDPTRQGVDVAGEIGQPVRAARDGEVVYSGAGLIGYGELVIIKHSSELLSAYGHNRVRLVKEGDKVKAGQKIAEMGRNAANRVLLHFEVRKNGKPVDPLPLLPPR